MMRIMDEVDFSSYDEYRKSSARAVTYVKNEMSTVLDDDYPDALERIFGELEECGFVENEIDLIFEEAGF